VIAILTTTDAVKLSAARALLAGENVASEVFDTAAGALWTAIIPQRLMIDEADAARARSALRAGGFTEASDGDWDLK
jgi:Putative prokaryotic signal transducing protein